MEGRLEVSKNRKKKNGSPPPGRGRHHAKGRQYPVELKLQAVKRHTEEGYSESEITQAVGVGNGTLHRWLDRYKKEGEECLRPQKYKGGKPKKPALVKAKIVGIKKRNPGFGVKRISQILRRWSHLPASAETVRKTLHEEELVEGPRKKPKPNPRKPRFFERARPNQMWQSDIFTFRLGRRNAYLIAFLDDHSRYVVGLGLYRSQTAEHVIESYRTAITEYGVPKEVLTDNGRQYTNWRGTSRFEGELKKDRVHHIKSRPHHPMTLGKVERFWGTVWEEFLGRAQFDSFCRERPGNPAKQRFRPGWRNASTPFNRAPVPPNP
jgi:transposase InsO family protein